MYSIYLFSLQMETDLEIDINTEEMLTLFEDIQNELISEGQLVNQCV